MKPMMLLFSLITLAAAGPLDKRYEIHDPAYQQSNQVVLENTLNNLPIGEFVEQNLPPKAIVSLLSLEGLQEQSSAKLDEPMVAFIEDVLIEKIVEKGFRVVERDQHIVNQFIREHASGDTTMSLSYGQWQDIYPSAFYASPKEPVNLELTVTDTITTDSISKELKLSFADQDTNGIDLSKKMAKTHLPTARYFVSYRVQEIGNLAYQLKADRSKVSRESRVKIVVRIHNTMTGQVVAAKTLTSVEKDTLHVAMYRQMDNFHYDASMHMYPNQGGEDSNNKRQVLTVEDIRGHGIIAINFGKNVPNGIDLIDGEDDKWKIASHSQNTQIGVGMSRISNRHLLLGTFAHEWTGFFSMKKEGEASLNSMKTNGIDVEFDYIWGWYASLFSQTRSGLSAALRLGVGPVADFQMVNAKTVILDENNEEKNQTENAFGFQLTAGIDAGLEFNYSNHVFIRPEIRFVPVTGLKFGEPSSNTHFCLKVGYYR